MHHKPHRKPRLTLVAKETPKAVAYRTAHRCGRCGTAVNPHPRTLAQRDAGWRTLCGRCAALSLSGGMG